MIIVCTEEERYSLRNTCNGECNSCVFRKISICPVDSNVFITTKQITNSDISIKE